MPCRGKAESVKDRHRYPSSNGIISLEINLGAEVPHLTTKMQLLDII